MTADSVVVLEPRCKGLCPFGVAGEGLAVGPLGGQGAVEALDLAVLPGAVGLDELLLDAEVCAALGITQKFIKPHCPWQNGKVERLNRTLATEWAYKQAFTSNAERAAALAPWLEHYNTDRRHSALGGKPPISRLSPT